MRELNSVEIKQVEMLEAKVSSMFNVFRREGLSSEDFDVLLFLLSMYNEGVISSNSLSYFVITHRSILDELKHIEESKARYFNQVYFIFEDALNKLGDDGFCNILQELVLLDTKVLSAYFPYIFDSVLYQISSSQGRAGGQFIQPREITRLICELADLPEGSKVFNPFAGVASFNIYFKEEQFYYGQELNSRMWALGILRLIANNRIENVDYVCEDSISNWPEDSEKFDLVVANPPFGPIRRLKRDFNSPNIRSIEHFLMEYGVRSLNTSGKLIAVLPVGFLFRGAKEKELREYLVEQDILETIIALPGGLLLNTGIPLIVLVINKNKVHSEKVRFIDAKDFVVSKNRNQRILDDKSLIQFLRKSKNSGNVADYDNVLGVNEPGAVYGNVDQVSEKDIERLVDVSEIKDSDYNLNVPRYFQKKIEGVKLGNFIEVFRGVRGVLEDKNIKFVRIKNLKDDPVDYKLSISQIDEANPFELRNGQLIEESCLLLAMRWKTLKPTYFEYTGTPVFINSDILPCKINSRVADTAFLVNEFHAGYVQDQLEAFRQGTTIPMLRRSDLLEVVIELPTLEEQRAKVKGLQEVSARLKELEEEKNALVHGKAVTQFNEFASLKHTLGRPRQNILDWTDNIIHFLNTNPDGFEVLNKSFKDYYEMDMLAVLQEIKRDINFMTEVLEKGENGFVVQNYEKSIIPLSEINGLINQLSGNGFNFKIKPLSLKSENLKKRGVYGNKTLLLTLIDNLLTNADKYGFETKELNNEVVFELTEVDNNLLMEIRNNGKPFPPKFDREKFITKYSTADSNFGTGLGGYDINRIAVEFQNPDWELILNTDPIYPVIFRFQFPIKLIN
ncbi:N-6 DNA methylase [Aestuariibaculum marinum]|uniref:site-specific DNA-methyltransferase (adenine-specific) n=1 Tax=Aestuariibaculum marinum TaxID=2683592 RepID=A0A8J6Q531_9FLAO|nr:N-6 DNA methylase [Aestuariibaculum marinum]MBD0824424.1 N-6 DNA methylase [Aestuariibaculum marinum]